MAIHKRNFLKRKLNRLKTGLKKDLQTFLQKGCLTEAIEHYRQSQNVDLDTAREVVMAFQTEAGRKGLLTQMGTDALGIAATLKQGLKEILAEGETMAAIEWCAIETGLDPDVAKIIVQNLSDETPASAKDKTLKALESLDSRLRDDVTKLVHEGQTIQALKKLKSDPNISIQLASDLVHRLQDADPECGRQCLVERTLSELSGSLKKDVVNMVEEGKTVTAMLELREQTGLDMPAARDLLEKLRSEEGLEDLEAAARAKLTHLEKKTQRELKKILDEGNKIDAIRHCHEAAGLSLGVATAVVEALENDPSLVQEELIKVSKPKPMPTPNLEPSLVEPAVEAPPQAKATEPPKPAAPEAQPTKPETPKQPEPKAASAAPPEEKKPLYKPIELGPPPTIGAAPTLGPPPTADW